MSERDQLQLVRHETPESVVCAYFDIDAATFREGTACGGITMEGEEVECSPDEMLSAIEEQKMWGFADKPNNIVHVWVGAGADHAAVIGFLAHEIGHNTGEHDCDDLAEERRADEYRFVTEQAYRWLTQLVNPEPADS